MAKAETTESTTPPALGSGTPLTSEAIAAAQAEAQAEAARQAAEKGRTAGPRGARITDAPFASGQPAAEDADEDTTTVKMAKVLVFRNDKTSIPDTVFAHEVRILRALHSAEQVKVLGEETAEVANFDVDNEYARLNRKYSSREGNPVGAVYPGARELANEIGVKYSGSGEQTRGPARSVQKRGSTAKKVIGRKR